MLYMYTRNHVTLLPKTAVIDNVAELAYLCNVLVTVVAVLLIVSCFQLFYTT